MTAAPAAAPALAVGTKRTSRVPEMLIVALLAALSVPALADRSLLPLGGFAVTPYRLLVVAAFVLGAASMRLAPGRLTGGWTVGVCGIILYNGLVLAVTPDLDTKPLVRGVANAVLNILAAFFLSALLRRANAVGRLSLGVLGYGFAVALSAIFEFILLQVSYPAVEVWRRLIRGPVPENAMLTMGGVSLDTSGVVRVGGLIGAPDTAGFILALTLPFLVFLDLPVGTRVAVFIVYTLAALATSSRTLLLALSLALLLMSGTSKGIKQALALMMIAALCVSLAPGLGGLGDSSARYTSGAASYQLQWRLDRFDAIYQRISENPLAHWVGQGFGAGSEEQWGLDAVTSGILGGDLTVSYLFGGFPGIFLLALFWIQILKLSGRLRLSSVKRGLLVYALFLAAISLIEPAITSLALRSEVLTLLLMAYPLLAESSLAENRAR